jgi:hypothetical protein
MIETLIAKVKGILLSPVETFRQSKNDELSAVFTYFGVLLFINALLSSLVAVIVVQMYPGLASLMGGIPIPVFVFIAMFVGGFILTLIAALWFHLWVSIFGGRKGIMQTVYAIVYAGTPRLLLGWIPVLSILFTFWSLVLIILGVRELQEMSTGKAVAAVLIAVIIPFIVMFLLMAYLVIPGMSVSPIPAAPMNYI